MALVAIAGPVVWILWGVVSRAVSVWSWSVLTQETTGVGGGLSNTIVGTLVITGGVGFLAGIAGIGTGVFLAEICPPRPAAVLRGASEVLAGVPSIVLGYVGYVSLVIYFHWGYSLGAVLIVMSLLVVPYVAKSTELAIAQVPTGYREGAAGLGMSTSHALRRVVLKAAVPGMVTGVVIALAIAVGETAPLLYTAGFSNSMPSPGLTHNPIAYLAYAVWTFYDDPQPKVVGLSYEAALILVVMVLVLLLLGRVVVRVTQRHSPERAGS